MGIGSVGDGFRISRRGQADEPIALHAQQRDTTTLVHRLVTDWGRDCGSRSRATSLLKVGAEVDESAAEREFGIHGQKFYRRFI